MHIDDEHCLGLTLFPLPSHSHPLHLLEIQPGLSPSCPPINRAVMVEISVTLRRRFHPKQSLLNDGM